MTTGPVPTGSLGGIARRLTQRARESARVLREEFDKGARGESDGPTPVLWDRPTFEHLKSVLRANRAPAPTATPSGPTGEPPGPDTPGALSDEAAADEVSMVLERIDWRGVTTAAAAADRASDVAERLRSLAGEVDWERMRPVAGKVATALVAAAATGHLGRLSGTTAQAVARAINGDQAVGEAAASIISRRPGGAAAAEVMKSYLGDRPKQPEVQALRPPGEPVGTDGIEVIPPGGFEARLAELRDLAGGR